MPAVSAYVEPSGFFTTFFALTAGSGQRAAGIFAGPPTAPDLLAYVGGAAPGVAHSTFRSFGQPFFHHSPGVAFSGTVAAPRELPLHGIWSTAGGVLALVALEGSAPPGVPPQARFASFLSVAGSSQSSALAFVARMAPGLGGVTPANDTGLWISPDGSAPTLALRTGDPFSPDGNPSLLSVKRFAALAASGAFPGAGLGCSADGAVDALLTLSDDSQHIVVCGSTGYRDLASTAGLPAPGVVTALGAPHGTGDGTVFRAAYKPTAPSLARAVGLALYFQGASGPLLVAHTGDPAPGLPQTFFTSLSEPAPGAGQSFLFIAGLRGRTVGTGTAQALYRATVTGSTVALQLLARTGSEPPGVPGARWAHFTSCALAGETQAIIKGTMVPGFGGVTAGTNTGLWAQGNNGQWFLLDRTGAPLDFAPTGARVLSFSFLSLVPGTPAQERSYTPSFPFHPSLTYRREYSKGYEQLVECLLP